MKNLEFFVPGKPVPQERPYVTRHGTFDRPKSRARKKEIATLALIAARNSGWNKAGKNVGVYLTFTNPNPRADLDNLAKLIMDALSGVAWTDDYLVSKIYAEKEIWKGAQPGTMVSIWNYPED